MATLPFTEKNKKVLLLSFIRIMYSNCFILSRKSLYNGSSIDLTKTFDCQDTYLIMVDKKTNLENHYHQDSSCI